MGNWHRVIGIDLGTTFSAVAAYNFDKQDVRIIPNRQNEPTTPSVVYISPTDQVSVGRSAKQKLAMRPDGVIIEAKRLMGHREGGGKKMVTLPNRAPLEPEVISAHILRELKANAEKAIGEPVHDAVITVPQYFLESQKNATLEAARIAKLNPVQLLNEPTAAAVAYGVEAGERQTFIVYDFGGGTFDVSIVRVNDEHSFDVLGTGGDSSLGGGDIDQKVVEWALGQMQAQFGRSFADDRKLVGRLRLEAERTKINICNEEAAQEFMLANPFEGMEEILYELDVGTFNALVEPLLVRTTKGVEEAMHSAAKEYDVTMDDIEAFILVGGTSKVPRIADILRDKFKKPIKNDLNADEVVAIGAGWIAKGHQPSLGPEIRDHAERKIDPESKPAADHRDIKDVVSHTLGVGLKDDVYDSLIHKDTTIPQRVVRDGYTTAEDNQTSVYVPVYQGGNNKASLNFKLGEVVVDSLTPEPKGSHKFSITFALDANGIFYGEMKHHQTGQVREVRLDRGQDQITEKRRIDLSEMVSSGKVGGSGGGGATPNPPQMGSAPPAANPIDELLAQAQVLLHTVPADKKVELTTLVERLAHARATNDLNEQASIVTQLTMFMMRNRGN